MHVRHLIRTQLAGKLFRINFTGIVLVFTVLCMVWSAKKSTAMPITGTDSLGTPYNITHRPMRVVSLVPEITEILIDIGTTDVLVGITQHTVAPEVANTTRVGGFLAPEINKIDSLHPDLILAADLHHEVREYFRDKCTVLTLNVFSIEDAMKRLTLLGQIFDREKEVAKTITEIRQQLADVAQKVAGIPAGKRIRAMRLMGFEDLSVPGDNSFQNDYIRAAGAIAPTFGKKGQMITITPEELRRFDPQVIYFCGPGEIPETLTTDEVKPVSAIRNGRIYSFSCDLTCRAGVNIGNFVSLLASQIYGGKVPGLSIPEQSGKLSSCVVEDD